MAALVTKEKCGTHLDKTCFCSMTYAAGCYPGPVGPSTVMEPYFSWAFYSPISVYITLLINNHLWTFPLEQNGRFSCVKNMQVFSFIFILQLEGDIGQQVGLGPV